MFRLLRLRTKLDVSDRLAEVPRFGRCLYLLPRFICFDAVGIRSGVGDASIKCGAILVYFSPGFVNVAALKLAICIYVAVWIVLECAL